MSEAKQRDGKPALRGGKMVNLEPAALAIFCRQGVLAFLFPKASRLKRVQGPRRPEMPVKKRKTLAKKPSELEKRQAEISRLRGPLFAQ